MRKFGSRRERAARQTRRPFFAVAAVGVALLLAGCAATPRAPGPEASQTAAVPTATAAPSASGTAQAATAAPQEKIGFCDGFSPQTVGDDIQDAKSMGMGFGRPLGSVFSQEDIEKTKGSYDFSKSDSVVKSMQDGGVKVFGTVFPTGIPKIPAAVDVQSFGNYVKAVVDRYNGDGKNDMPGLKTKIVHWQVGIEPFCDASADTTTCYRNFFDLTKTAYQSAKSVDPSLMISPGGPGPIYSPQGQLDTGVVSGIYKYFFEHGGATYMDFFNFHFLVGSGKVDIKQYIDYWKQYVGSKELWLSETGTRDVGDRFTISSNADEEAAWAKQHIQTAFANGVSKIFWCRTEHSFADMPKIVETLQNFTKQFGATPTGSPVKRAQSQGQGMMQGGQMQGGQTQGGQMQGGQMQGGQMQGGKMPGGQMQGGQQPGPSGGGGYCGDNICQEIERTTGGCPTDCR